MLGPVFASFADLLLADAVSQGIGRLAFVARDGEFLREVTRRFAAGARLDAPAIEYIHLSRLSTALTQHGDFGEAAFVEARTVRAGRFDAAAFLAYFGLQPAAFAEDLQRHGLLPATPLASADAVRSLLRDAGFAMKVQGERKRQRELLAAYLRQQGVLGVSGCALVDIGWRGSIVAALVRAFSGEPDYQPLHAYYLGYWHELGCHPLPGVRVKGLLSDCRAGRTLLEGAAFYAAALLEAVSRAEHGTVTGYRRDHTGTIVPLFAAQTAQRHVEVAGEQWRAPIREGVLDYVDAYAQRCRARRADAAAVRRDAQRRLFRLAFFPRRDELDAVAGLAHTEGHVDSWSRPLVDAIAAPPWRACRRWLAGLASPWRTGYIMATGGPLLAGAYVGLESLLLLVPRGVRRGARKAALSIAGIR